MHFCSCLHFVLSAAHLRSDCTSIQFSDYWGKFFTQRVKVGELWRIVENQSRTEQEMKTEEPKDVQNNEKSRSRESEIREGRI